MTYGEFLAACRKLAGKRLKKELSKSEFARLLGFKQPGHYIGAENDREEREPGRDLLEKAAALAGFKFEDCIVLPTVLPKSEKEAAAIQEFERCVASDRLDLKQTALSFADSLKALRERKSHK